VRRAILLSGLVLVAVALVPLTSASADKPTPTCDGLTATIVGTNGDDVLPGTIGNDVIVGLGGDDTITGDLGDDLICGGSGDDRLSGQGEDDRLFGQAGNDYLDGGEGGCCNVATNTGDDFLSGGPGRDELHTSDFPTLGNTLRGDQGRDRLFVWSGGWAYGGSGKDLIRQFTGNALLDGGNGNDDILDWNDGGAQNETLTLVGGNGADKLASEDATSTANMDGGRGPDTCTGGDTTTRCES
jgi:Ca2+-binding RTX toxin-like protein